MEEIISMLRYLKTKDGNNELNELFGDDGDQFVTDQSFETCLKIQKVTNDLLDAKLIQSDKDIQRLLVACIKLLHEESKARGFDYFLKKKPNYDIKRWELVSGALKILLRLMKGTELIFSKETLDTPSMKTIFKISGDEAIKVYGKKNLESMRLFAFEIVDWFERINPDSISSFGDIIITSLSILRISSIKKDIGDSIRKKIFNLICKFDAKEEEMWLKDPVKYFKQHSILNTFVVRNMFASHRLMDVKTNCDCYASVRNYLIEFFKWSLDEGCDGPVMVSLFCNINMTKMKSIEYLMRLFNISIAVNDARKIAIILELFSYIDRAHQDSKSILYPSSSITIHDLDYYNPEFKKNLIHLLDHKSVKVRAQVVQMLILWCVGFKRKMNEHLPIHEALIERLPHETDPVVNALSIVLMHTIMAHSFYFEDDDMSSDDSCDDSNLLDGMYPPSLVKKMLDKSLKSFQQLPCLISAPRFIGDIYRDFKVESLPLITSDYANILLGTMIDQVARLNKDEKSTNDNWIKSCIYCSLDIYQFTKVTKDILVQGILKVKIVEFVTKVSENFDNYSKVASKVERALNYIQNTNLESEEAVFYMKIMDYDEKIYDAPPYEVRLRQDQLEQLTNAFSGLT